MSNYPLSTSLECSTLKLHMLNRNICPSLFCLCGSVKNIDHYLLHCRKYATVRKITILENALANSTDPNLSFYVHVSNYKSIVENQRFPFRRKIYDVAIFLVNIFVIRNTR